MRVTLRGARLVDAQGETPGADITLDGATIAAAGTRLLAQAPAAGGTDVDGAQSDSPGHLHIDAHDAIITPGFIDVHTHGGGGYNLHTTDAEEIANYARWAPETGVTAFLVAVVGVPDALPAEQLQAATTAVSAHIAGDGAEPLGIHLEGPYISAERRGAHPTAWLRKPNPKETETVLALTAGALRLITLAPELPGAAALIKRMVKAGVTVSVGHTNATYEQTLEAIRLGATHMTHCCNAMRPLRHRDPGPLGAAAQAPSVNGEVIADGVHVHPAMVGILVKMLGADRTIVVTDALAAAGAPEDQIGSFEFAGQAAHVSSGVARLADGSITGSILTMDQALRNMLEMTGIPLPQAVGMLTANPAHAIHADDRKGRLAAGYDADLLIFDSSLTLQATLCAGTLAWATEEWRARLAGLPAAPPSATAPMASEALERARHLL